MEKVQGRQLGLRLFMEGVECDITAVKVSCGVNQAASAVVTIPAVDAAHQLEPRTLVHIFYFDSRWELGTDVAKSGGQISHGHQARHSDPAKAADAKNSGVAALLTDKNDWRNWKLLFAGEVMGYSFRKMGGRREIILACQDFTSYWDNCRLYWGRKKSSVFNSYKTAIFSGATQLYRGKSKVDSSNDLNKLLQKKPSAAPSVPGLLGGIFSLLESATGVFSPDAKKQFRGCNDFLSQAEIRLKLTRQIGASEKDDTSLAFTNSKSFKRYLRKLSKSVGYTASFMQFTNMLMGKIYHVWNSQTAPAYISDGAMIWTEVVVPANIKYKHSSEPGKLWKAIKATYDLANSHAADGLARKTGEGATALSRDELLWDGDKVAVGKHKEFDDLNTKTGIMSPKAGGTDKVIPIEKDPLRLKGEEIRQTLIEKAAGNKSVIRQANAIFDAYSAAAEARGRTAEMKAKQTGKGRPGYDEKESRTAEGLQHTQDDYFFVRRKCEEALKALSRATRTPTKTIKTKVELRDRLFTTYFHPDLFMAPPPKCNVIFPDHVQTISFSRNWMSEISRLWLHGRTASGRNKKDCYFSPNAQMLNGPGSKDCEDAVKKGASFVMNHEKYTGIIPSIVGLGDGDIFKKIHQKELKQAKKEFKEDEANKGKVFDSASVSGEAKFSPQPHLQRAANYMFFAQRYATRTMQLTLRYSPQIVAGMPALVLDPIRTKSRILAYSGEGSTRYPDNKDKRMYEGQVDLAGTPPGTHYLGVVAEIVHIIDVSGGAQTVVTLAKCREHNEGADIFKKPNADGTVTVQRTQRTTSWRKVPPPKGQDTDIANISKEGGSGGGTVTATSPDDAEAILGKRWSKGTRYRIKPRKDGEGEYKRAILPLDGEQLDSSGYCDQDGFYYDGAGNQIGSAEGVQVDVERLVVGRTKPKDVTFTWEATVMPPWFSSIYTPAKIGREFYQPMYGCSSILDDPPFRAVNKDDLETSTVDPNSGVKTDDESGVAVVHVPFAVNGGEEYNEIRIPEDLLQESKSSTSAANALADIWLGLKEIGASTDLYIDTYIDRQYASMLDILGNTNPAICLKMYPAPPEYSDHQQGLEEVRGFHGDAFGPWENLKKGFPEAEKDQELVAETLPKITDDSGMEPRKIDGTIDPRKVRYEKVLQYINALRNQGFRNQGGEYESHTGAPES